MEHPKGIVVYCGRPIEELSREELIEALNVMASQFKMALSRYL